MKPLSALLVLTLSFFASSQAIAFGQAAAASSKAKAATTASSRKERTQVHKTSDADIATAVHAAAAKDCGCGSCAAKGCEPCKGKNCFYCAAKGLSTKECGCGMCTANGCDACGTGCDVCKFQLAPVAAAKTGKKSMTKRAKGKMVPR